MKPVASRVSFASLALMIQLAAAQALAHSVWIEPTSDGRLLLRFAEPDGSFEKSPGHLDELSPPVAFSWITNGPPSPLPVTKGTDHFVLVGASSTHAAGAEATYLVMTTPGRPGRKPVFYARWQPAGGGPASPSLNLDLVPGTSPGEVRAYFRGEPLPGLKVLFRTPDEKEQELTTDAKGSVRFESTQKGLHQMRIERYREPLRGFYLGAEHEVTSHNASLTWVQP